MTPRYRVLLVDDDPAVLVTAAALLSNEFDVTSASSGEEAVALLTKNVFDVVCTDYKMGRLTGLDVITYANTLSYYVAKILVTGQNEVGSGAGYYVMTKPYDSDRLIELIERAGAQAISRRRASGLAPPRR